MAYVNHFLVPDAASTVLVQAWCKFETPFDPEDDFDVGAFNAYEWELVGEPLRLDANLGGTIQAAEYLSNKNKELKDILSKHVHTQTTNPLLGAKSVELTLNIGHRTTKSLVSGEDMTQMRHKRRLGPNIDHRKFEMSGEMGWTIYFSKPCWNGTFEGDNSGFAKIAGTIKNQNNDYDNYPFVIDLSFIIRKKQ